MESYLRLKHDETRTWIHATSQRLKSEKHHNSDQREEDLIDLGDTQENNDGDNGNNKGENGMDVMGQNQDLVKFEERQAYLEYVTMSNQVNDEDIFGIVRAAPEDVEDLYYILSVIPTLRNFVCRLQRGEQLRPADARPVTATLTQLILFCTESTDNDPMTRIGKPIPRRQDLLRERGILDLTMDIIRKPFEKYGMDTRGLQRARSLRRLLRLCYRFLRLACMDHSKNGLYVSPFISFMQQQLNTQLYAEECLMELFRNNMPLLQTLTESRILFFIQLLADAGKTPQYIAFLSALCSCDGKPVEKNQNVIASSLFDDEQNREHLLIIPEYDDSSAEIILNYAVGGKYSRKHRQMPVEQFVTTQDPDLVDYLLQSMKLLAELCEGRNKFVQKRVSKMISFKVLQEAILDHRKPQQFRSACVYLMSSLYIDAEPAQRTELIQYTRKWDTLQSLSQESSSQDFQPLKEFINKFLSDNAIVIEKKNVANFVHSLVQMVKRMLNLGMYSTLEDVRSLVRPLSVTLENGPSLIRAKTRIDNLEQIKLKIKQETCETILLIQNRMLDFRITNFLSYFKHIYESTEMRMGSNQELYEQEELVIRQIFKGPFRIDDGTLTFEENLLRLTRHGSNIASAALQVLFRKYVQKEEFVNALNRLEVLRSADMVELYEEFGRLLRNYRKLLSSQMTDDDEEDVLNILDTFLKHLEERGPRTRRILRCLGAQTWIMETFSLPYSAASHAQTNRQKILRKCRQVLTLFVTDSATNQQLVFPYFERLLSLMGGGLGVSCLLEALVKNNSSLVVAIDETHIRHIMNLITAGRLNYRYLRFLKAIILVDDQPIKRNQAMVTKMLLERDAGLLLFRDKDGIAEKKRLTQSNDPQDQYLLYYHVELLRLLGACVRGKNYTTEVKLQHLFSINELKVAFAASHTSSSIRNAVLLLLDEIYLYVERHSDAERNDSLWTVLRQVIVDLENFSEGQMEQEDIEYVFHIVVPMFGHLAHVIKKSSLTQQRKDLLIDSAQVMRHLYSMTLNPEHRRIIQNTLAEYYDRSIASEVVEEFMETYAQVIDVPKFKPISVQEHTAGSESEEEIFFRDLSSTIKRVADTSLSISDFPRLAHLLIRQPQSFTQTLIMNARSFGTKGSSNTSVQLTVKTLKTLREIIVQLDDNNAREEMQIQLTRCGAVPMVVDLLCSGNTAVTQATLQFAIALLEGGNVFVQKTLMDTLAEERSDRFCLGFRERIRTAVAEVKELKYISSSHKEENGTEDPNNGRSHNNNSSNSLNKRSRSKSKKKRRKSTKYKLFGSSRNSENGDGNISSDSQDDNNNSDNNDNDNDDDVNDNEFDSSSPNAFNRHQMNNDSGEEEQNTTIDIIDVLRFLQLLCEGHYLPLQQYLRYQEKNLKPVDMITECIDYLLALYHHISSANIPIAVQLLRTLTEFVQGPCIQNQLALATGKLLSACEEMLIDMDLISLCITEEQILELHENILILLTSILEGNTDPQIRNIMNASLKTNLLQQNLENITDAYDGKRVDIWSKIPSKEALADLACQYYILLSMLDHQVSPEDQDSKYSRLEELKSIEPVSLVRQIIEQRQIKTSSSAKRKPIYEEKTQSVEILRDGHLERVYFQRPKMCKDLSKQSKEKFLFRVDRSTPQTKVESLFHKTKDFMYEMEHQQRLGKLMRQFRARWDSLKFISFIISIVVNLGVVIFYRKLFNVIDQGIPVPGSPATFYENYVGGFTWFWAEVIEIALGFIQLILIVLLALFYVLDFGVVTIVKHWYPEKEVPHFYSLPRTTRFYVKCAFLLFRYDAYMWFLVLYVGFALSGLIATPLLYSVLLLEVTFRFQTLNNIYIAIAKNGPTLLATGALTVAVIYMLTTVVFWFFTGDFVLENGNELCTSLFQCFVTQLNLGLRGGGFWEDVFPTYPLFWRILYDMTFYFLIVTILLNIVFGAILVSFDELRTETEEKNRDARNICFICGIERQRFERRANEGLSFERHYTIHHNIWNYVYFIIYLLKKDVTEFTGTEQYVYEKIKKNDVSFFPVMRSLELEESDARRQGVLEEEVQNSDEDHIEEKLKRMDIDDHKADAIRKLYHKIKKKKNVSINQ